MTDFLSDELRQKNLAPVRIFSMADKASVGRVKLSVVLEMLKKCMPHFSDELIAQIPLTNNIKENQIIDR